MYNIHNEHDLLMRLSAGEQQAFRDIYDTFYRRLCFFANTILEDLPQVEDNVQEIFVKLWNRRREAATITNLRAYLYTATRNACLDYLKHLKYLNARQEEITRLTLPKTQTCVCQAQ